MPLSVGQCATLACLLEAAAPKPGNVHPGADFPDMAFADFLASAVAIGPAIEAAAQGQPVGRCISSAVAATRHAVGCNTNLGSILLIAPLAAVPRDIPLARGVAAVLARLDPDDAEHVYQAIRLARPGGLGRADRHDVEHAPPENLLDAMRHAADRDLVARQYAEGYPQVLGEAVPWLRGELDQGRTIDEAIVRTQLRLMSRHPDSLIARKRGLAVARESAARAAAVLDRAAQGESHYRRALAELDAWLRADGTGRNPGTTADLIAAALFALLRDGAIRFGPRATSIATDGQSTHSP
jgi:triphosphoribosyl-dephospho-CoA synthase